MKNPERAYHPECIIASSVIRQIAAAINDVSPAVQEEVPAYPSLNDKGLKKAGSDIVLFFD